MKKFYSKFSLVFKQHLLMLMLLIVGFAGSTNSIYSQSKKAKIGRDPYYGKGKPVSKETKVQPPKITPGEFNIESRQDYITKARAPIEAQKQDTRLGKFFGESPEKARDAKVSIQMQQDRDQDINDYIDMSKGIGKDLHLGYKSLDEMEKAARENPEEFHKKMEARRQAVGRDKFEDSVLAEHDKAMEKKSLTGSAKTAQELEDWMKEKGWDVSDIEDKPLPTVTKQTSTWKKGVIPTEEKTAEKIKDERKQAADEFDKEIGPLVKESDRDVEALNKKLEEQKQKRTLQKQTEEKFEDNPITKIGKYVEDMNKVGAPVILPEHKQQAAQAKNTFDKLPASAKKKWSNMTYGQKAGALAGIGVAATAIAGMIALAVVDPAGVFDAEASARNAATLTPTEGQITQDTVQKQEPVEEITRDAKQRQREEETVPVVAGAGYEFD